MIGIVKLILNPNSETHMTMKIYENRIIITLVIRNIKEQVNVLDILNTMSIPKCEYFLCLKHWSNAMKNDVLFQAKLHAALNHK